MSRFIKTTSHNYPCSFRCNSIIGVHVLAPLDEKAEYRFGLWLELDRQMSGNREHPRLFYKTVNMRDAEYERIVRCLEELVDD